MTVHEFKKLLGRLPVTTPFSPVIICATELPFAWENEGKETHRSVTVPPYFLKRARCGDDFIFQPADVKRSHQNSLLFEQQFISNIQ